MFYLLHGEERDGNFSYLNPYYPLSQKKEEERKHSTDKISEAEEDLDFNQYGRITAM